jgi:hypothetical protein
VSAPTPPAVPLRDLYAAAALTGLLPAFADDLQPGNAEVVAMMAFDIADAMLAEREAGQ